MPIVCLREQFRGWELQVVTQTSSFRRSIASRPSGLATADEFRDAARSFRSAAVQKPGAVSAFSVPRWAPVLESQKIPESLLFWAFSPVTARKAHCTVATRPSQIPTEENLKCVQVLDLYSTSTIGRERRRGRDLIRHGSPRAQGG